MHWLQSFKSFVTVLVFATLSGLGNPGLRAVAQVPASPPTAEKGHALSAMLCSNCHLISDGGSANVPTGPPSFRVIANRNGQTGQRIKDVLMLPHPPMPVIQLTNDEILNILSYLEKLRTNEGVPPLISPSGVKPKYPSPS